MKTYILVLLLGCSLLAGCSDKPEQEKPEPLGKLDFRPNSEFGIEAAILALQLGKQVIDERMPQDGVDKAEGYRFLLRLIEMNLNTLSGDMDSAHPQINRCPSKNCKLGFDNPDYTYVGVFPLSAEHSYHLRGEGGNADIILFQVLERGSGAFKGTSKTHTEDMVINDDGSWDIYLGSDQPGDVPDANWLQLEEDAGQLILRIAHNDWNNTIEPSVTIEVVDGEVGPVEPFTPMRMAITGFALSKMIPNQVQRWIDIIDGAPLNGIDTPCGSWANDCADGGFGFMASGGKYNLDIDEALIIEAPAVPMVYGNIQLSNMWGESLDYANKQTSLNGSQAHKDADNVYRYVLAHKDPGVPNWLDVSEHPAGGIFMRWVETEEGQDPAKPASKVVAFDAIRENLPADTPHVNAEQRAKVLADRLRAYNRRVSPAGYATQAK